jgi:hypothetical protein
MLDAMGAVSAKRYDLVLAALIQFKYCVRDMGSILRRMNERCSPDVFYRDIRPFLAGSKNMALAGLPNGVFYDESDGKGKWRQYSGGSNAQSSLVAFCDVVLGVQHCESKHWGSKNEFFAVGLLLLEKALPLTHSTGNEELHATIAPQLPPTCRVNGEHSRLCCCQYKHL